MKKAWRRIDVNLEELDRVLDGARAAPLSESDRGKLRDALHALAALLVRRRNSATSPPCERSPKPEPRSQSGIQAPSQPRSCLPNAASSSMAESRCLMPVSSTCDDLENAVNRSQGVNLLLTLLPRS
jgi:hypothetical protein